MKWIKLDDNLYVADDYDYIFKNNITGVPYNINAYLVTTPGNSILFHTRVCTDDNKCINKCYLKSHSFPLIHIVATLKNGEYVISHDELAKLEKYYDIEYEESGGDMQG